MTHHGMWGPKLITLALSIKAYATRMDMHHLSLLLYHTAFSGWPGWCPEVGFFWRSNTMPRGFSHTLTMLIDCITIKPILMCQVESRPALMCTMVASRSHVAGAKYVVWHCCIACDPLEHRKWDDPIIRQWLASLRVSRRPAYPSGPALPTGAPRLYVCMSVRPTVLDSLWCTNSYTVV